MKAEEIYILCAIPKVEGSMLNKQPGCAFGHQHVKTSCIGHLGPSKLTCFVLRCCYCTWFSLQGCMDFVYAVVLLQMFRTVYRKPSLKMKNIILLN